MKVTNFAVAVMVAGSMVVGSISSQAVPITGGISMAGGYSLNGPVGSATAFMGFTDVLVPGGGVAGSYSTVPTGLSSPVVSMVPFTFNPFSSSVTPLWSFTSGGKLYTFDLTSLVVTDQTSDTLDLRGAGMLHITGFDDTVGTWVFTANSGGTTFSFSASNTAVPDGGLTMILLGAGLASLGMMRRFLNR